ncbi:hypothetical protein [Actinacidiphila sp. ITFR-21]|uniref:hypothetical protein n=1 Tax=Actinacidiphila sp. ITFR-21 TaxID=3075199 RepID=UPI00288B34C4|nr:hypothetical protein [Streptomyces sp. ITFR-21]WNI15996.1 hypothetical protein RLT57_10990 [Streptomyces sp. ITFR-21]
MSIRRAATAIGAISLGLIALTACDKPTAQATVTVGSKTVTAEASSKCYAKGAKLPQQIFIACLQAKPTHHITVPVGDQVRIGVDPGIGDKGWLIVQDTTLATAELLKDKTYWSIDSAQLFNVQDPQSGQTQTRKSVTLNIVESGSTTGNDVYRVISFTLLRGE